MSDFPTLVFVRSVRDFIEQDEKLDLIRRRFKTVQKVLKKYGAVNSYTVAADDRAQFILDLKAADTEQQKESTNA